MLIFFSFDTAKAQTANPPEENSAQLLEIEEKRNIIKEHLQKNKELEDIVEKKSKKVEDLLVKVPEITIVPQELLQSQIEERMDTIFAHLTEISEQEGIMWRSINSGNRDIEAKRYSAGIKKLNKTINALEAKYTHLTEFNSDLDDILAFLSSIQQK